MGHSKVDPKYIYPLVETVQKGEWVTFKTILRKKKDGKWYNWHVYSEFVGPDITKACNIFHMEVYNALMLGIIDLEIKNQHGESCFELAASQEDEITRLKKIVFK